MAFSEIELKRIEQEVGGLCKRRSPTHLKDELSLEYRIKGHDVEVFERRPAWGGRGGQTETAVAKPSRGDLPRLVKEIDEDPYGCFFG